MANEQSLINTIWLIKANFYNVHKKLKETDGQRERQTKSLKIHNSLNNHKNNFKRQ